MSDTPDPEQVRALVRRLQPNARWTLKQIDNRDLRAPALGVARTNMAHTLGVLHKAGLLDMSLGIPEPDRVIGAPTNITPLGRMALNIMRGKQ